MTDQLFRAFAIVEVFGHERLAGEVTEANIGGCQFVRVDVPAIEGQAAFTRFYGQNAIYSITPVSEEIARQAAAGMRVRPVNVYLLAPTPSGSPDPRDEPGPGDEPDPGEDPSEDWGENEHDGDYPDEDDEDD